MWRGGRKDRWRSILLWLLRLQQGSGRASGDSGAAADFGLWLLLCSAGGGGGCGGGGGPLVSLLLLDLLHLVRVLAESVSEFGPHLVRDGDGVAVGGLDLAHPHENTVLVGAHVEKEPLVIHRQGGALGQLGRLLLHAVVVDELGQGVAELDQPLRWQGDGLALCGAEAWAAVDCLADAQESPALVLLQIHKSACTSGLSADPNRTEKEALPASSSSSLLAH
ncbi:hypothetical protein E2320_010888 [Naja naja]|nr:hypothetical protein E2320_010888 [Naja naja]